ncbi:hypothetical protein COCC4DRAFT_29131 [Bipolaris maydis ATCC 48331]|uniref:Uncharacterized protein n=2 Tax=Cochliobolus heterostrophus TaxID=5016 RepID=M2V4W1_COCH5|nr:uncharacterized protein COCC4DRAFT_29131 [Bipolaris maydis ATCC 48331]EMD95027.1 hypothetical protein COCHEDRAFT_1027533 [Bipolaris maydis C5]ENH98537.1 hypothetical protein COCC4DRAFT_29131 [Bipolaris maydis ATCC 48331]
MRYTHTTNANSDLEFKDKAKEMLDLNPINIIGAETNLCPISSLDLPTKYNNKEDKDFRPRRSFRRLWLRRLSLLRRKRFALLVGLVGLLLERKAACRAAAAQASYGSGDGLANNSSSSASNAAADGPSNSSNAV